MMAVDQVQVAEAQRTAFCAGDWAAMRALMSDKPVYSEPATSRRLEGADAIIAGLEAWRAAFPDVSATTTHTVEAGNTVVQEIVWSGTHTGPLASPAGAIPATGKRVVNPAVQVLVFEGDKLQEVRHYFDALGMLAQIGALPGH